MSDRGKPIAESTIEIDAPLGTVWSVMTDLPRYAEWNPFLIGIARVAAPGHPIDAEMAPGAALSLTVKWPAGGGGAQTIEIVTRYEPPATAADGTQAATMEYRYTGFLDRFNLVRGRRLQSLQQAPGRPTLYKSIEPFHGWLTSFIPLANVRAGFEAHATALKGRAEKIAGNGGR